MLPITLAVDFIRMLSMSKVMLNMCKIVVAYVSMLQMQVDIEGERVRERQLQLF